MRAYGSVRHYMRPTFVRFNNSTKSSVVVEENEDTKSPSAAVDEQVQGQESVSLDVSSSGSNSSLRSSSEIEYEIERMKLLNEVAIKHLEEVEKFSKQDVNRMISEQKIDPTKRQNLEDEFETFLQEFFTKREIKEDDTMISTISSSSYTTGSSSKGKFPYLVSTPMDRPYSKQELFVRQHQHSKHMAKLGSQIEDVYLPHEDVLKPVKPSKLSIQTLLSAGCHLGHSTSLWRPSTQPFIYGEYKGIHIIDLEQTLTYLKRAAKVVEGIAERGGLILFLGTREGQKKSLEQAAKRTNGYYVSNRWIPGSITNCTEINGIWPRHELDMEDKPTQRELEPAELDSLIKPDLIVILNPIENRNCIREAIQSRIPTIGLVDTDSEPSLLTYPIPCNDDSIRATNLVIGVLSKAGEIGRKRRLENVADYKKSLGLATESAIFNERR